MTREEAIKNIKEHCYFANLIPQAKEALDMAIIALENQKTLQEELEKIKTEIQGLIDFEESCCGNATLGYSCLRVINESIEAIRGKNNRKGEQK